MAYTLKTLRVAFAIFKFVVDIAGEKIIPFSFLMILTRFIGFVCVWVVI